MDSSELEACLLNGSEWKVFSAWTASTAYLSVAGSPASRPFSPRTIKTLFLSHLSALHPLPAPLAIATTVLEAYLRNSLKSLQALEKVFTQGYPDFQTTTMSQNSGKGYNVTSSGTNSQVCSYPQVFLEQDSPKPLCREIITALATTRPAGPSPTAMPIITPIPMVRAYF